jgi:hypothetical protein
MIISIEGLPGCKKDEIFQALKKTGRYDGDKTGRYDGEKTGRYDGEKTGRYDGEKTGIHIHSMRHVSPDLEQKFTSDPIKWSLTYQSHKMLGIDELINHDLVTNYTGNPRRQVIVDDLYSMRHVYVNYLRRQDLITEPEFDILDKLYKRLFVEPKVIIYLFGTFDSNYKRMLSESGELKYTKEEFKKLQYQFEWIYDTNNCHIPIYKISVEDSIESIVNNIREILEKIDIILT